MDKLSRLNDLLSCLESLKKIDNEQKILGIFEIVQDSINKNGIIYTAGNGGSSCCASHLTEELVGKYDKIRPPIKSICLSSNSDLLTCIANDFKYKNVFSRQINGFCSEKDVLILFTTSGYSKNLFYAVEAALNKGTKIIVFSGKNGGSLSKEFKNKSNYFEFIVKSDFGANIQEIHLHLIHSLLEYLEA